MPDVTFATLDAVPDGLKEHAKAVGDAFVVKVVPQSKLEEFRSTNTSLAQERDALKVKAGSLDSLLGEKPFDEFKTELEQLRAVNQQVKDGTLKPGTDVESEVQRRVSAMKTDHERQLAEKAAEASRNRAHAAEAETRLKSFVIDREITTAAMAATSGLLPSSLPDLLARARGVFVVGDDHKLTAKDGEAVIYGADGATPMKPGEWIEKLKTEAPHFFKPSAGGGAQGGTGGFKIPGYTAESFSKLPAVERLKLADKHGL